MKVFKEIKRNVKKSLPQIIALRNKATKKEDGSFVTEGDLMVDKIIADAIALAHPNALIVSEENHSADISTDNSDGIFVVDPIDGTENFKSGLPEWGVSICYYPSKYPSERPECMLWCPEMDLYLDNSKVKISAGTTSRIAGISSSLRLDDLAKTTPGYEYRMFGCCVYSMIQTINGCFRSFENPRRANSWDILAGLNLALQAGMIVKVNGYDYIGEYLPHIEKYSFRIEHKE